MPADGNAEPKAIKFTIQGFDFETQPVYAEGDVLTANEAVALDQVRVENIRNNFAAQIKRMKAEVAKTNGWMTGEGDKQVPDGDKVSNDMLDADELQTAFDAYVESYEFGARRVGGTKTSVDPVEREARRVAKEKVKELLKANNFKVSDIPAEKMDSLIDQALEQYPAIREQARTTVEANKGISLEGLTL